jgi:hypothetical protein
MIESTEMKQQDELKSIKKLTEDQIKELLTYPSHWRPTLCEAALKGESIKETYEELKDFEAFM